MSKRDIKTVAQPVALIALCLLLRPTGLHAQDAEQGAESILHRMGETYASLKSYSDAGVVYEYTKGMPGPRSCTKFRIFFARPDRFRFDMTNNVGSRSFPENYKLLVFDGKKTTEWWDSERHSESYSDINLGVSGFTGISSRSVHNIPSMFQTNLAWQETLDKISSSKLLGDETVNKVECYHVKGGGKAGREFEIWVGKNDSLIRKVRTSYAKAGFRDEEIHEGITANQQIASDVFEFTNVIKVATTKKE